MNQVYLIRLQLLDNNSASLVHKQVWSGQSEELGDSGWKPGWYKAVVQAYDTEEDTITVVYPSEPGCMYTMGLSSMITSKKIKSIHTVI